MQGFKHLLGYMFVATAFVLIGFFGWLYYFANTPLDLPSDPYPLTLKHGTSLRGVAQQLTKAGILRDPWGFVLLVRLHGKARSVQAGSYQLSSGTTPLKLYQMVTRGDFTHYYVRLIDGWNFRQIRQALDRNSALKHETLPMSEAQIRARLNISEPNIEGLLLPDTYNFVAGTSDLEILQRAHAAMQTRLAEAWDKRAENLPFDTPYQALIVASIVEKETAAANERARIAAVFINRLRANMRLQTDPTVIYGLGERFNGNLRKADLTTDTPYNTYTREGLPPTPIAMPGFEALKATLNPAKTKDLYFVSRGDGTHHFSESLDEHNLAVERFQKMRN